MAEHFGEFVHNDLSNYAHILHDMGSSKEADENLEGLTIQNMSQSDSTTSLQVLLSTIKHERNKDESNLQLISSDGAFFSTI